MLTRLASATLLALVGATSALPAQTRTPRPSPESDDERRRIFTFSTAGMGDPDRPRLGLALETTGLGDTLGTLVSSVTADGPADKAGIKAGDRLVAINGVNLRLSKDDAEEEGLRGAATRRLMRELGRVKAGDTVELRLLRDGKPMTMSVKTVAASEMEPAMATMARRSRLNPDRASLGIGLGSSGSRRDTLGIFVASVATDGPAEKAGMEEGDRLAAINGVDLRVPREDAGDFEASSARVRRLSRELEKVKAGDEVELRVYRAGQPRTVKVKTASARDLERGARRIFITGDDAGLDGLTFDAIAPLPPLPPLPPSAPRAPMAPGAPRMFWFDGDGPNEIRLRVSPEFREEMSERTREALERALEMVPRSGELRGRTRVRVKVDDVDAAEAVDGAVRSSGGAPRLTFAAHQELFRTT